jgi:hypothetical protein
MTDWKKLCAELERLALDLIDVEPRDDATIIRHAELFDRVHTALAQPEPEPPADGEVAELVDWLRDNGASLQKSGYGSATVLANLARTADLLEQLSGQSR